MPQSYMNKSLLQDFFIQFDMKDFQGKSMGYIEKTHQLDGANGDNAPKNRGEMVVVKQIDKFRLVAETRGLMVATDLKSENGGDNTAPEPPEILQVSLAQCIAMFFLFFCNSRNIDPTGFSVELEPEMAQAPKRFVRFDVNIILPPNFPYTERAAALRYVSSCPVGKTLKMGAIVEITLD